MNMRKSPPKQLPKECGIKIKAIDSDNAVAKCKNHNKMLRLKLNFIHIFLSQNPNHFFTVNIEIQKYRCLRLPFLPTI